jgi:hypothetical protein
MKGSEAVWDEILAFFQQEHRKCTRNVHAERIDEKRQNYAQRPLFDTIPTEEVRDA